ncbi:FadR family transcriptional regulator [Rhodococcus fascians]|uniref:FadR/GntR family transcriptional regulator n=1 Tax=Rhodococcus sp. 05-2255-1e TaxID=2022495 RepID=UPI000B9B0585|nr:FCD domain-containing protein [Rhodococcus sp. 05-2255-1e]MBY4273561.1 FadR family transcriptional regulator [Rhodococcus fascians]MBY4430746.1 FadR family transcriptional regulator [Rhodococcus fascians]OZE23536.1 GntR family transcriptional regulator [Rhodococcus sp. 05-2255-1e]
MSEEQHRPRLGRPQKMSEKVANVIADDILGGGIVAGQRLPTEKEMVAEYGVARTTVREALRLLESRGLVTIKAGIGGGPVACRPQYASLGNTMKLFLQLEGANISDVIDVRLTLEPIVAAQAAASVTDDQLDTMQSALDSMRADPSDYANFQSNNATFQTTIYRAAGNPAFRIVMEALWLLVRDAEPSEHPMATRKAAIAAQQKILDALRLHDADGASAAMSVFVHDTALYYRKRLASIISRPVHWQL